MDKSFPCLPHGASAPFTASLPPSPQTQICREPGIEWWAGWVKCEAPPVEPPKSNGLWVHSFDSKYHDCFHNLPSLILRVGVAELCGVNVEWQWWHGYYPFRICWCLCGAVELSAYWRLQDLPFILTAAHIQRPLQLWKVGWYSESTCQLMGNHPRGFLPWFQDNLADHLR